MKINYHNEKTIEVSGAGENILTLSLKNNISHVHACGGNGLCSTCRVLILEGSENLHPPNDIERALAKNKGFESNVRLACQTRVCGDVSLKRLVLDKDDLNLAVQQKVSTTGKQQKLAVMFTDIRQFTPFVESNLPYDVVHILNRYFFLMGQAVLRNNGFIDKYMGDGLMALFGVDSSCPMQSCLEAVTAGLEMQGELQSINEYLQSHFGHCFAIGIGIDFGEVLVGELGHPEKQYFTAIGNTVNVAARIESATKQFGASLLVSDAVYQKVAHCVITRRAVETELKGTWGCHKLHEVMALSEESKLSRDRYDLYFEQLTQLIHRTDAPGLLRLAWHDAATFDPLDNSGGANASVLLAEELQRPENRGLERSVELIQAFSAQLPKVSMADLIALAAVVSIRLCGGPQVRIRLGRKDSQIPAKAGGLPGLESSLVEQLERFSALGFETCQFVALNGAHTLGGYDGKPFTEDLFQFNNSYFKTLLLAEHAGQKSSLLNSDLALLQNAATRKWVQHYALYETDFFQDFAVAIQLLLDLGVDYPSQSL